MSESGRRIDRKLAVLLAFLDACIVYFSFASALKIRQSEWNLFPVGEAFGAAATISVGVYLAALVLAGLYRRRPVDMHLDAFLRSASFMLIGAMVALTLTYLVSPLDMPPRSVTAAQFAFSVVGVLGLRAGLRYIGEVARTPDTSIPEEPIETNLQRFLDREPVDFDHDAIRDYLTGRSVMVTGAGGSVGSVLCQQLVDLNPFRLVMVDVSEFNLFQLEKGLRGQRFEGEIIYRIADVRDESIMRTVFASYRPDIVFHAAAYKHVPLMERHPVEAFTNNTLATVSLINICEAFDTEQFIFVSTDKAVEPSSVLGATKRLAEWYIRSVDSQMRCKTVRFGNVLQSQGSVVPTFVEQIASGGPVTVTHPEMERYFMTADEASSLILGTLLLDAAPIYAARLGEPIEIRSLARHLIEQLKGSADSVPLVFTGLRPGEKLSEKLWSTSERVVPTENDSILGVTSPPHYSRTELDAHFSYLTSLCRANQSAELRKALFETRIGVVARQSTG